MPQAKTSELHRHCQPIVKLSVRCEACGHQAIVATPMRGNRLPTLYCGYCGDREPLIEPVRGLPPI